MCLPLCRARYAIDFQRNNWAQNFWQSALDSAKGKTKSIAAEAGKKVQYRSMHLREVPRRSANMITAFVEPFEALFNLQRALEARLASDWLQDQTTSQGPFPPINVFQQGGDLLAIIELPGIDKSTLQVEAKENTIRIAGKKVVAYPDGASVHRRERVAGEFDRTISLPVDLKPDGIKAEYRDGILTLFLPRSERDKPRTIAVS
jgi:HSP20 family protein